MIGDILLTLFFVFLNGFFVAAEFAIVKVRASQLEMRVKRGSALAKLSQGLVENLDSYLSATQLGITLASLGLGWIGESVVAGIIINSMKTLGIVVSDSQAHSYALPISFATITFLHIVFGELAPKTIAIQKPEQVTLAVTLPMRLFYIVFKPIVWFLNGVANQLLKVFGFSGLSEEDNLHSAEELKYLIKESSESGLIGDSEQELIENVFEFAETPIRQIMIPRQKITAIDIKWTKDEIIDLIIDEGYSRLPVYEDSIDNIIGLLYSKDMLNLVKNSNLFVIQDLIRPTITVNEEDKVNVVLNELKTKKSHFAVVVDEFGGTAGIVTMEDIVEEIFGDIQDEYDDEQLDNQDHETNVFILKANTMVGDANEFLPIALEESEDWDTIGGYLLHLLGRIPNEGEIVSTNNYIFEILTANERKIEEVKLTLIEETDDN